jgi:hypothetical protein
VVPQSAAAGDGTGQGAGSGLITKENGVPQNATFGARHQHSKPPPHCYQQDSSADLVADFVVFYLTDGAGRAETVQASSADEAVAAVLADHPGAITTVVPAAAVEGCNRTLLLWEWMESAMASAPPAQHRQP